MEQWNRSTNARPDKLKLEAVSWEAAMEQLKSTLSAAIEFGECVRVVEKEHGNIGIIPRGLTTDIVLCDIVAVSRPNDAQKRRVKLELADMRLM